MANSTGNAGNDPNLLGGLDDDVINGLDGSDVLNGMAGNDNLIFTLRRFQMASLYKFIGCTLVALSCSTIVANLSIPVSAQQTMLGLIDITLRKLGGSSSATANSPQCQNVLLQQFEVARKLLTFSR